MSENMTTTTAGECGPMVDEVNPMRCRAPGCLSPVHCWSCGACDYEEPGRTADEVEEGPCWATLCAANTWDENGQRI